MTERRLLQIIAILLTVQVVIAIVPAPFTIVTIGEAGEPTWWPPSGDIFEWWPDSLATPWGKLRDADLR